MSALVGSVPGAEALLVFVGVAALDFSVFAGSGPYRRGLATGAIEGLGQDLLSDLMLWPSGP
jgi:hypothetical protein